MRSRCQARLLSFGCAHRISCKTICANFQLMGLSPRDISTEFFDVLDYKYFVISGFLSNSSQPFHFQVKYGFYIAC